MSARTDTRLPFDGGPVEARIDARDREGRARAVDPRFNVALEASAGTGKTRVLVDRYVNLLGAGVDPANVLAITFTRKAAAEMRDRILATLRAAAARGEIPAARWRGLRDRLGDIAISTIDAFCLSLLREFPLEADVDPGFTMADETEVPRLVDETLDRALRICRGLARDDENVALAFAQLSERRVRAGLAVLLHRRIAAPAALRAFLAGAPAGLDVAEACGRAADGLRGVLESMPGGTERFLDTGPLFDPAFVLLAQDVRRLVENPRQPPAALQRALTRVREHFLTQDGSPRKRLDYTKDAFASKADLAHHRSVTVGHAEAVGQVLAAYRRDLNVIVARGIARMYAVAAGEYRQTLDAHAVLDFPEVLLRTLDLLRQMDEFAQSRYRLESRYHHILVDEFQDTSRAQWELVSLLVESWGAGQGLAHSGPLPPSVFIVGDRKQSIYGFRDADVSVLEEASRFLGRLRPDGDVRRSISRSFRSVPAILAFVNDVCADVEKAPSRRDAFRYDEQDRFPIDVDAGGAAALERGGALGLVVSDTPEGCAAITAAEIERLIDRADVRDRETGVTRRARPGDVAILFRTRESHREFEAALEARGIPAYVYKGLGFFDADEIKDALALLWYLADPLSNLRAAAFLRSRFVRLSDEGLRLLAPALADALRRSDPPPAAASLDAHDARALALAREWTARWRGLVDRLPPAELFDLVLAESAYGLELRGPRLQQARENLKKMRGLVRRIQNRGYATLGRIAAHVDRLSAGEESNAAVEALDAVNLMTVHASKGLEFPIVFVVNLARGTGSRRDPVRVAPATGDGAPSVSIGDFQSDVDEDGDAKAREETKRLLYVALTRARDRLYLGSVLTDGRLLPGRGSLAEVFPPSLIDAFAQAAAEQDAAWIASSGARHRFRAAAADGDDQRPGAQDAAPAAIADLEPLEAAPPEARSVAALLAPALEEMPRGGSDSDRLAGTLVHRLIERAGLDTVVDAAWILGQLPSLLRPAELVDIHQPPAVAARAASLYTAVCAMPEVRAACARGERLHEVPFSMATADGVLRGTIDCLIHASDGSVIVLEFKTGRPRPEHRMQVDLYVSAAAGLFPGARVESLLVYPDGVLTG
jgi:ATP-dependent helicase/nuclease subunit A